MQTYTDSARRGEVFETVRYALLNGSLWAVGSAWSVSIRAVVLELLPSGRVDIVVGELLAAMLTTILGVGIAILVARDWRCFARPAAVVPVEERDPLPSRPVRRMLHV